MHIPVGSLIRYMSMDDDNEYVFGVVIENLDEYDATDDRDSVRVHWADDHSFTIEIEETIRDPECEWVEILNEGR